jgi:NitT/TauT family transport system substrate-binding protein
MAARAGFLAGSVAVVASVRAASAQPALPTLRVGAVPVEGYAQAFFGLELGMFSKAGLTVELQNPGGSAAAAAAIVGGSLDIIVTTPLLLASAVVRGVPFVVAAAGALSTTKAPNAVLVTVPSSTVRTAKDLVGKTVGVYTFKQLTELSLDAWLAQGGVEPEQVKVIEVSPSAMVPALQRGQVDAGIMGEPTLSAALKTGEVRQLANALAVISPRYVSTVWCCLSTLVQRQPEAMKRFAGVIYETARWTNTHPTESAQLVAKYTKMNADDVSGMIRNEFAESLRPAELQPLLDAAYKFKFISRAVRAAEIMPS